MATQIKTRTTSNQIMVELIEGSFGATYIFSIQQARNGLPTLKLISLQTPDYSWQSMTANFSKGQDFTLPDGVKEEALNALKNLVTFS